MKKLGFSRRLRGTLVPHLHRYAPDCEGAPGGHFEWLGVGIFWCRHGGGFWRSWRIGRHVGWIDPLRD